MINSNTLNAVDWSAQISKLRLFTSVQLPALYKRYPFAVIGAATLLLMTFIAIFAPLLATVDPQAVTPLNRLKPPSWEYWFGTDALGRDVYSRVMYGSRVSLTVGISVALLSTVIGLAIGLITGFVFMDGDRARA